MSHSKTTVVVNQGVPRLMDPCHLARCQKNLLAQAVAAPHSDTRSCETTRCSAKTLVVCSDQLLDLCFHDLVHVYTKLVSFHVTTVSDGQLVLVEQQAKKPPRVAALDSDISR